MTYVLGLDLSLTSTGRATIHHSGHPTGTTTDTIKSTAAGDDYARRWDRIHRLAHQILGDHDNPALVVLEGPSYGSGRAQANSGIHDRAGLWWTVASRILDAGYPLAVVAPKSRAKWATNRGNAGKSEVAVAVARLWPHIDAHTDDEWDALALATMGAQHLGWDVPTRAHHAAALTAVAWPQPRDHALLGLTGHAS